MFRFLRILTLLALCLPLFTSAKPVSSERALALARKHLETQDTSGRLQLHQLGSAAQAPDRSDLRVLLLDAFAAAQSPDGVAFHLIADPDGGFVIIAGDDRAIPVLATSRDGVIASDQLPPAFVAWLGFYERQITELIRVNPAQDPVVEALWQSLEATGTTPTLTTHSIPALITTVWNQSPYYNALCPLDTSANERTLTGCVATAMAQIMRFWQHPISGKGSSRFNHANYGLQSADYGSTQYSWGQMPQRLTASSAEAEVEAVATLMYHCGVSVQMDYGVDGSGISDITKVVDSLRRYFDYATTVALVKRQETTDSIWLSSLKHELDAQRPIFYVGFDPDGNGGHAWVCDGYDSGNRFHMNWGWNGYADGFFTLNALQAGGNFNYSDHQMAVIGIAPQASSRQQLSLALHSALTVSPDPLESGKAFTVQANLINESSSGFAGTLAAGIFSSSNNLLLTTESLVEDDLPAGYHYVNPLSFGSTSTGSLQPGTYYAAILYRSTAEDPWIKVGDGDFSNWVPVTLDGPASAGDLALYAPLTIGTEGVVHQNTEFEVSFNVQNPGDTAFDGVVEVDLYDLDGRHRTDVGTLFSYQVNGLAPNHHYIEKRTATVRSGVDLAPGEYLAAVTHRRAGSAEWELTGEGGFVNPVSVKVQEGPDRYEPNDDDFFSFTPSFSGNRARFGTQRASIHHGADLDLFYFDLPSGFDYHIEARVHDSWWASNGNSYTTDVFWVLVSSEDDDVGIYDDQMDMPMRLNNGGGVAIGVSGWGTNVGTYDLDIEVLRLAPGAIDPADPRNYTSPLYRFYRRGNDSHFFTANAAEKDSIIETQPSSIWVYEGISQRVMHAQVGGAIPVYRLFNRFSRSHFYTASEAELAVVQLTMGHIFSLEGVAFYVLPGPIYGASPVYRFYSTQTASHFFTISRAERDQIIATIPVSKLRYEGVAWYAYP